MIFHIRRITNGFSKEFAIVVVCRQPLEKKLHRLLNTDVGVWYRRWDLENLSRLEVPVMSPVDCVQGR